MRSIVSNVGPPYTSDNSVVSVVVPKLYCTIPRPIEIESHACLAFFGVSRGGKSVLLGYIPRHYRGCIPLISASKGGHNNTLIPAILGTDHHRVVESIRHPCAVLSNRY